MEYRTLGRDGLRVSALCLGALTFGNETSAREAARIVAHARAAGVNFIDTSDVYVDGESERIVGRLIARDRARWVLATKVGFGPPAPNARGLSRKHIMAAIDASLRRLKTDYVDLYYFHLDDQTTPLEEAVRAVGDLIRAGKTRYFGLSNIRGWRLAEVVRLCDLMGIARPIACQPCYNAATRVAEGEVIPAAAYYGLGVVPFSPLARGVLTGKYAWGRPAPRQSRAGRRDRRLMMTEWRKESVAFAAKLATRTRARGLSAGQFALLWVLANAHVAAAIAGPRTLAQWNEYLGALDHRLTAADHAFVDRVVPPGHSTTFGYTDPAYPVIGRAVRT